MKPIYLSFAAEMDTDHIHEELEKLETLPERRVLVIRFPDGTCRVVAEIVKLEGCPQDVFDEAMKILADNA